MNNLFASAQTHAAREPKERDLDPPEPKQSSYYVSQCCGADDRMFDNTWMYSECKICPDCKKLTEFQWEEA